MNSYNILNCFLKLPRFCTHFSINFSIKTIQEMVGGSFVVECHKVKNIVFNSFGTEIVEPNKKNRTMLCTFGRTVKM
jgi:hypothetical protein